MTSEAVKRFDDDYFFILSFLEFLESLNNYTETTPINGGSFARMAKEATVKLHDMNEIVDDELYKARNNVINLNGGK